MSRRCCTIKIVDSKAPARLKISRRFHKASQSAETKSLLLPILTLYSGVTEVDWLMDWIKVREEAELKVAGETNGALQPASDVMTNGS